MSSKFFYPTIVKNKHEKTMEEKQQENKQKKEELLKQFKIKNQEIKAKSGNAIPKQSKQVTKCNKKSNTKELKNLKQKNIKLRNEIQKLKKTIKPQKDNIYRLTVENTKLRDVFKEKDNYIDKLKEKLSQANKEKEEFKSYKDDTILCSLKNKIESLTNKNIKQTQRVNYLNELVEDLKNQLINAEALGKIDDNFSYKGKYKDLEESYLKSIKKLKKKLKYFSVKTYKLSLLNSNLKGTLEKLLQHMYYVKAMIFIEYFLMLYCKNNRLEKGTVVKKLNEDDVYFNKTIEAFPSLYQEFKKITNSSISPSKKSMEKIRNKEEKNSRTKAKNILESIQYGYLSVENDIIYFISIDDEIYEVVNSKIDISLDNKPCKAIVSNNEANIVKIYKKYKLPKNNTVNFKRASSIVKKRSIDDSINYYKKIFQNKTILMVASKNRDKYTAILTMCGANIIWHDSFVEHPITLTSKSSKADVIILCANHMSHTALNVLNLEDPKIEIIYNDTITRILSRIKYVLVNKGED